MNEAVVLTIEKIVRTTVLCVTEKYYTTILKTISLSSFQSEIVPLYLFITSSRRVKSPRPEYFLFGELSGLFE